MGNVRRGPVGVSAAVAVVVVYAWAAAGLRPFTLPALVVTLAGGLAAMAIGGRLPPAATAREGPIRGAWLWAVLAGAAGLWQLQAFVQHPRSEHPTISSLTNDLLPSHPTRTAAMVVWLAAAVWLARR